MKTSFSLPHSVSSIFFLIFLLLLSTFKLCKFSISTIFFKQLFLLSLKHKPFLMAQLPPAFPGMFLLWSAADSAEWGSRDQQQPCPGKSEVSGLAPSALGVRGWDGAPKRRVNVPSSAFPCSLLNVEKRGPRGG